jgi:hypothetical protein
MTKPYEVERHDFVINRMQGLICELEKSIARVRVLFADAMDRNHELRLELSETQSKLLNTEARLNQVLEAVAAYEARQ